MIGKKINILLVDDDEDDCFMFQELVDQVKNQKFEVTWASSFDRGKLLISSQDFQVCFLDFRLGVKTGIDFLKEVIAEGCKVPMILLTGYGELEVDLEAMSVGAADYLVKDQVTPYLIEKTIRYAIHRAQSMKAILESEAQILMQDRLASVGLLASSLAHEIGTPLGVIRGRAEFLDLQVGQDPQVKKNVNIIISQIDRVSKLIHSLLNLARGEQKQLSERVKVNEIISDVTDLMRHEFDRHGIQLRNHLNSDLMISVKAESGPLHQVFLNLLVNSVHAIESEIKTGSIQDHFIDLSLTDSDREWMINIEDSGCGISETSFKNLFKPFFTTKEIGVGTGLGLATSYRIVESWGGRIVAKSHVGKGALFQVILPKLNESKPI